MRRTKNLILATAMGIALSCSAIAQEQPIAQRNETVKPHKAMKVERAHEPRQHRQPPIPNLTEQQNEAISDIKLRYKGKNLKPKNIINEKMARLRTLSSEEKPNMRTLNKIADEIGGLRAEIMKNDMAATQEIRALLTEKQRIVFDENQQRHPKKHKYKMKHKKS